MHRNDRKGVGRKTKRFVYNSPLRIEALEYRHLLAAILFDPGEYLGGYTVSGSQSVTGPVTFDLPTGNHTLQLGNARPIITLEVASDGNVTSGRPTSVRATDVDQNGINETLTFENTTITVDPVAYQGACAVVGVTANAAGARDVVVVPDMTGYWLELSPVLRPIITFDVGADGNVTSGRPTSVRATDIDQNGINETLTFENTTISINPVAYQGAYSVLGVSPIASGTQSVVVVPDLNNYWLGLGNLRPIINFDVDAGGNVTSGRPTSVSATGNTLTMGNTVIAVNPDGYTGTYNITDSGSASALPGPRNFVIVPDLQFYDVIAGGVAGNRFATDASGIPSPSTIPITLGPTTYEFTLLHHTLYVTTAADTSDGDTSSLTDLIASPGADGAISLREAIIAANNTANQGVPDQIYFAIPGTGPFAIEVSSQLPTITDPVTIDGTTQYGYVDSPVVSVSSNGVPTGLSISAGNSTLIGLAFEDFNTGIALATLGGNTLTDVDVSWAGATATGYGVYLSHSSDNVIDDIRATNRGTAVYLDGSYANNVVQNSDLSGAGGYSIYARNNGDSNQYRNNNLSSSASVGLVIENDTQFQVSGNDFTGTAGVSLGGQMGATISLALGPGQLDIDLSQAIGGLNLNGVTDSTILGLNLSYAGTTPTGTGLKIVNSSNNVIDGITATNRWAPVLP